jgi:hypothetical protein
MVSEIELFHCTVQKLFIRKRYHELFPILVFNVQVTSLIQALAASIKLSVSPQLLDLGQSVELFRWVISLLQGLYLYTNTEKRTHNTDIKHPCPEWDLNP